MISKTERTRRIPNSFVLTERVVQTIPHSVTALHESEVNYEYMNMRNWFPDGLIELKTADGYPLFAWYSDIYHSWDVYYQETFIDPFFGTNEYRLVTDWSDSTTGETGRKDVESNDVLEANVITSKVVGTNEHKPVLDIDVAVVGRFFETLMKYGGNEYDHIHVYPSSTHGHYHLYVDRRMSWTDYCRWMECLVTLGILEEGFYRASVARGYSATRLPWIAKQL